ncbi:hypothetical protein MtrunA17_Chr5g0401561 [Medicago truncatula]|uniref:Uncharacterized protein n=1 Tax=Medicago truncatula TaxID=3880 RepID=A0A396HN88_MEDTR|nr:hypothetical protein MtrunA17_Chr5g0401561 [Medicago truncatula]
MTVFAISKVLWHLKRISIQQPVSQYRIKNVSSPFIVWKVTDNFGLSQNHGCVRTKSRIKLLAALVHPHNRVTRL